MSALSFRETVAMNLALLRIPLLALYVSLFGRWSKRANGRPLNRVLHDEIARFVLLHLSIRQLQHVSGSSLAGYTKWTKQKKMAEVIDELGNDARLMWVGSRETDHVVIYCHGGGFVGPLSDFQVEFWHRVQKAISKGSTGRLGVAILQYSLSPASFPTQLDQLLLAVHHIMSLGVPPSEIFLAGDSAGANIVLQLLGHVLHPSPSVGATPLSKEMMGFRGVCLISPWVMTNEVLNSENENEVFDLVPITTLRHWQNVYLADVPDSQKVYIQPDISSPAWFNGLAKVTARVLVTVGNKEVLRDAILGLATVFGEVHGDFQLDTQDGGHGVHDDPMFDIGAKSTRPHPVEERVIQWFAGSLREKN
ncbi:alpha beta-hydrolase [Mycena crocata]|nr:alpha beta-hydrolase [Mycena crocata]